MQDKNRKAMFAKGSLPSKKINIANGRPDQYLTLKEQPNKIVIRDEKYRDRYDSKHRLIPIDKNLPRPTHFISVNGHLTPVSDQHFKSGIFHSTGFKHPSKVPLTSRGFNPPTEEFDIWTDHYGNVLKTRQGTGTYNGGDIQATENGNALVGSVYHTGKQFLGHRPDLKSRTPHKV